MATLERARGLLAYEPTVPVKVGAGGGPEMLPAAARNSEMVRRSLRRRQRLPCRDELMRRYRSQDAFRNWRDDYFLASIDYGSLMHEDGSVELCMPSRTAARLFEATYGFEAWRNVRCPDPPVYLLNGECSGRLDGGRDPVSGIRTMFPLAHMQVMPGATYTGPMDQREQFEQHLHAFAGRIWPS